MNLTDFQTAGVKLLLRKLEGDPAYVHPMTVIRRLAGPDIAKSIKEERAALVDYNKMVKSNAPLLSTSAMDYWTEARSVLAYGKLALSRGARAAEQSLSRKCEALEESFAHRVPDREKGHFLIYDINDMSGENWDDRWHSCVDFNFPILRDQGSSGTIANTMREAQITVLSVLAGNSDCAVQ
jgi:hypothetical protein